MTQQIRNTQTRNPQTGNTGLTLERLYSTLMKVVARGEANMNEKITKLENDDGSKIGQTELLALQSKLQSWTNMSNIASGILRAVGDALKASAQNVR
ncbi:MAG: EscF/YscF/HrpA family type III secretion system needle major subunit [Puniceicoccales bacterium]|jgi:hypothetical protein|nr:EscF/YscF/HrpA family type III secretion system needle major subunit [Puniceicoccales bacterium]